MIGHVFLAVLVSFVLHEGLGHYLTGVILGTPMKMDLNSAVPIGGFVEPWHAPWVAIAGPVVTILQAVLACWLVVRKKQAWAYPFVLIPFLIRFLPYIPAAFQPQILAMQDEGEVSLALGLPVWVMPLVVNLILFPLVVVAGQSLKLNWQRVAGSVGLSIVGIVALLLVNEVLFDSGTFLPRGTFR